MVTEKISQLSEDELISLRREILNLITVSEQTVWSINKRLDSLGVKDDV